MNTIRRVVIIDEEPAFAEAKHSASVSGAAIQFGPIAKGDSKPADAPNGDKDGEAGGAAGAKAPTSARRKEIDKAAASPRWEG